MAYMNMKKSTIITALVAILSMAVIPMFAQEENGFKKFDVREDFTENGMLHPLKGIHSMYIGEVISAWKK